MGKQVKYMVLNKDDLLRIIAYLDKKAPSGTAEDYECAVIHLERAGKKYPGQVVLTDEDQKKLIYGWDV